MYTCVSESTNACMRKIKKWTRRTDRGEGEEGKGREQDREINIYRKRDRELRDKEVKWGGY